jgi:lipase chaperone LimK
LAKLADDISTKQKGLKMMLEKMQDPKTKKVVQQYYDSLETLRGTLMGTKQTSMFADEQRIRENISELYSSVCYQEVKPSNLQEERVKGLKEEIKKATDKNTVLTKTFGDKIKAIQEKEILPKSKVDINKNN